MMKHRIYGVGTDIVELARIERILRKDKHEKFLQRILTKKELELCRNKERGIIAFAGGRFAAKEAVAKALGTGIGKIVGFQDIEILPDANGKPECLISEKARQRLQLPSPVIHISISHSQSYATAMAVAETWEK